MSRKACKRYSKPGRKTCPWLGINQKSVAALLFFCSNRLYSGKNRIMPGFLLAFVEKTEKYFTFCPCIFRKHGNQFWRPGAWQRRSRQHGGGQTKAGQNPLPAAYDHHALLISQGSRGRIAGKMVLYTGYAQYGFFGSWDKFGGWLLVYSGEIFDQYLEIWGLYTISSLYQPYYWQNLWLYL